VGATNVAALEVAVQLALSDPPSTSELIADRVLLARSQPPLTRAGGAGRTFVGHHPTRLVEVLVVVVVVVVIVVFTAYYRVVASHSACIARGPQVRSMIRKLFY
jgi:hypothetical protein